MARARKPDSDQRPNVEDVVMRLAANQHRIVTRAQLRRGGIPPDTVDRRLKSGRLRPVHRGVYAVGPIQARYGPEMAAVLACGESAAVSHGSAAALWGLLSRSRKYPVEISVVRGDHSRRPGLRVHRTRTLMPEEVTTVHRVPVTKVGRTLFDLAGGAGRHHLERALAHGLRRELTDRAELLCLLSRHARCPGVTRLRVLPESAAQLPATRSEAEDRFLALVRKAKLPSPAVNTKVAGYEVDFLWRRERFVVEVDGFEFHSSAAKFETDRRRDAVLAAAGIRVIRVTWRQLVSEPEALLVSVAQALVRKGFK